MMLQDDLLLKAFALLILTGGFSVYSWLAGTSVLVYQVVTKRDNPKEYWTATIIITLCALVCLVAVIHLAFQHIH